MSQWVFIMNIKYYVLKLKPHIISCLIVWLAVVLGINSVSNADRKVAIVRGTAEDYYTCIVSTINQNTTASHTVTN